MTTFHVTGFNHTSYTVMDMDKSVQFWEKYLGYKAASVSPRTGKWQGEMTGVPGASLMVAHLFGHGHHLEFLQYVQGATPGKPVEPSYPCASHVCLEVDDIEKAWQELLAAGATEQGKIATVNVGPVKGCKAGYLRDPNGILFELLEVADPKKYQGSASYKE